MTRSSVPTRTLSDHPDLDQLRRQAKELLDEFHAGQADAVAEVATHYHGADPTTFALHDAQLVLARAYGFESWPRLKAFVDGVTIRRLDDAVRSDNVADARMMLRARPELATLDIDNHSILHHAVVNRSAAMVRLLMEHGANARFGFYPHGDATSPYALAVARRYDEIVAIIEGEEQRRRPAGSDMRADGWTPLHVAAFALDEEKVRQLLGADANPNAPGREGLTPLDAAATATARRRSDFRKQFDATVRRLRSAGAQMTARAAVALGDVAWLQAAHANGTLPGPLDAVGGLLRVAVTHDQTDVLTLLLDFGFDPDERTRVPGVEDIVYSFGYPLWECAATGKLALAEILLDRGADPNAMVYASGTPVWQAYGQRDSQMIALLERHGGVADLGVAASHRNTELAKTIFARAGDKPAAAQNLLGAAACGGDPELLRLALHYIDWPRDDRRWFGALEQPLRLWNHGPGHWCHPEWDRTMYFECFRLLLTRCDPNLRGRQPDAGQFGLTILHSVAGSRPHVTADDRLAFATMLLDAGARLDIRDHALRSTPLGWACRWGRVELVHLFLAGGADPIEQDAEPWATPLAWARRMRHSELERLLGSATSP